MTREGAKEFYPILQAFAEGRVIECRTKPSSLKGSDTPNEWTEMKELVLWNNIEYRIKPESKYRPFKNTDECWQEMLKHQPFGWIKKISGHRNFLYIMELYSTGIVINDVDNFGGFKNLIKTYDFAFAKTTFADGTPFGIKEEV